MKILKWFPVLLFCSCIDMITEFTFYNSLYFQGGSWIEIAPLDSMKMGDGSNDFTLQFWISGSDEYANDGPAMFSLIDTQDTIKLALFRDSGKPNAINTIVNSVFIDTVINEPTWELDWTNDDEFYLISILFSDSLGIKGYINSTIFLDRNDLVKAGDAKLMIGTKANEERTILGNFWYGYMDEIRLWNTWLDDNTIQFQIEHPDKFGEYYRYTVDGEEVETYLDSLIGLWRFNLYEATATVPDESSQVHNGTIYTLPNYSVELSEKCAQ